MRTLLFYAVALLAGWSFGHYVYPGPPTPAPIHMARYCASDVGLWVPCVFSTDEWSI